MRKSIIIVLLLLLPHIFTLAQVRLSNEPARPSAEAWQMTRYGDVAPSLYTGTMALSVPVYTYKDPDFEIPISLEYSSNGCVPNVRAGVLGPDWALNAGGVITRELRGLPDEQELQYYHFYYPGMDEPRIIHDITLNGFFSVYLAHDTTSSVNYWISYFSPSTRILKAPDYKEFSYDYPSIVKYEAAKLESGVPTTGYELEPDVFHFSFLGHSGAFILQPNKEVVVFDTNESPDNFKITVTSDNIKITMSDGYSFWFSSSDYVKLHDIKNINNVDKLITSWTLKKITAPNGRSVNYNYIDYSRVNNIVSVRPTTFQASENATSTPVFNNVNCWDKASNTSELIASELKLQLLDKITIDGGLEVFFQYTPDTGINHLTEYYNNGNVGSNTHSPTNSRRLLSIDIKYNSDTLKTCRMKYGCDSRSESNVSYLESVSISGLGDFHFDYHNTIYPIYGTFRTDHWGYYNERPTKYLMDIISLSHYPDEYFMINDTKAPCDTCSLYGMLTKVTYPTGGYSSFEYEAHDYSKAVARNNTSNFDTYIQSHEDNKTCGGVRIKSVSNFDNSDSLLTKSSFSYKTQNDSSKSSGILLNSPRYSLIYSDKIIDLDSIELSESAILFSNSLTQFGRRDIEYSEVTETDLYGNATRYLFSNSTCNDLKDSVYFSLLGIANEVVGDTTSIIESGKISIPTISYQFLRGRLLKKTSYDSTGKLLCSSMNEYAYSSLSDQSSYATSFQYFVHALYDKKDYVGKCNLYSSEDVTYYECDSVKTRRTYEYNNYGQVKTESFTDSDNHTHTTKYMYVTDVENPNDFQERMINHGAINRPLKVESLIDNVVKLRTDISYVQIGGTESYNYKESSVRETDLVTNVQKEVSYTYDSMGRLIEKVENSGTHFTSYVWGYGGMYPVAIIENCPIAYVTTINGLNDIRNNPLEGNASEYANSLRNMGECTLYEYEPFVGVSKIVETSGKTTLYRYNASGKLSSAHEINSTRESGYLYSPDNRLTE